MKFRNLFLFVLASAALLAGCKEDEPVSDPAIEVKPKVLSFTAAGAAKTVSLTANGAWEATVEYDESPDGLRFLPNPGMLPTAQ